MDENQRVYERFIHEYTWRELWPPERAILSRFKSRWHQIRMLDIGVGTGRTTYTFAAITKEYVGIDYVPAMIERCLRIFGENASTRFYVCDARDLSRFVEQSFDFVMFSWNGIDAVSHDERMKILKEVHRVLDKKGHFFFSTHSIYEFPFRKKYPVFNTRNPLRSVYRWAYAAKHNLRLRWMYRHIDVHDIRKQQYAILTPPDHRYQLKTYYVRPEYQAKQLEETGFKTECVYNRFGEDVDPRETKELSYLYFLCRPT